MQAIVRPRFDPWIRNIPWRIEWLPIPVFLPEEFHGQRSLEGCYSPWGRKESDMAEWLALLLSPGILSPSFHLERKLWSLLSAARAPWVKPSLEVFPAGPWSLPALTKASHSQCYISYRYLLKRWSYSLKVFVFRAFSLEELALVLSIPNVSGTTLLQNSGRPLVLNIIGVTLPFPLWLAYCFREHWWVRKSPVPSHWLREALSWGRRYFFFKFYLFI